MDPLTVNVRTVQWRLFAFSLRFLTNFGLLVNRFSLFSSFTNCFLSWNSIKMHHCFIAHWFTAERLRQADEKKYITKTNFNRWKKAKLKKHFRLSSFTWSVRFPQTSVTYSECFTFHLLKCSNSSTTKLIVSSKWFKLWFNFEYPSKKPEMFSFHLHPSVKIGIL